MPAAKCVMDHAPRGVSVYKVLNLVSHFVETEFMRQDAHGADGRRRYSCWVGVEPSWV
jgi:hypothetical protein